MQIINKVRKVRRAGRRLVGVPDDLHKRMTRLRRGMLTKDGDSLAMSAVVVLVIEAGLKALASDSDTL